MIGTNLLGPEPTLLAADLEAAAVAALTSAQEHGDSVADVVKAHPDSPLAWAVLAREAAIAGKAIETYAFARVGYHRGLDLLRKSGWRGAGPVPWSHEPNRGVLRALYELREASAVIGETNEVERLTEFLDGADEHATAQIAALLAR